jgi:hypothetical protein
MSQGGSQISRHPGMLTQSLSSACVFYPLFLEDHTKRNVPRPTNHFCALYSSNSNLHTAHAIHVPTAPLLREQNATKKDAPSTDIKRVKGHKTQAVHRI